MKFSYTYTLPTLILFHCISERESDGLTEEISFTRITVIGSNPSRMSQINVYYRIEYGEEDHKVRSIS